MLLEIRHESIYRYSTTANYSIQYARLMPRSDAGQRVLNWRIDAPGCAGARPIATAMWST